MTCSEKTVLSHPWDTVELQGDFIIYFQTLNTCREKGVSPLNTHGCFYFLAYSESQRTRNTLSIVKCRDHFVRNGLGEREGEGKEEGGGSGRWVGVCSGAILSAQEKMLLFQASW